MKISIDSTGYCLVHCLLKQGSTVTVIQHGLDCGLCLQFILHDSLSRFSSHGVGFSQVTTNLASTPEPGGCSPPFFASA